MTLRNIGMASHLRGLYAITEPRLIHDDQLINKVKQVILGGARLIQYRNKTDTADICVQQASALLTLCDHYKIPLIINDDVALAREIGAHGVHIGQQDMHVDQARAILGTQAIIGASCYNRMELARSAQDKGADYVAFGSFFNSTTKPDAVQASVDIIVQAKQSLQIHVCAIGGITIDNAKPLIDAGVDMLAVIHGVFSQADIRASAEQFSRLL